MQLFLHNPDNVLIVRGNHEDFYVVAEYGFLDELKEKFSLESEDIKSIIKFYEYLPVALYLGCENDGGRVDFIQCCHGGMELGYDSSCLLKDENNENYDEYEWLNINIEKKRGEIGCSRHDDSSDIDLKLKEKLYATMSGRLTKNICEFNGFQWSDFDFFNKNPDEYPVLVQSRGFSFSQLYTTFLLEKATKKNSKNKVLAVFRAHQHDDDTVPHILKYGNGIYKLWNNEGSESKIQKGFDWITQWSGKKDEAVPLDMYSVWTFNVAPRTGHYERRMKKIFNYDTVARLVLKPGFNGWELFPRQIWVE